VLLNEGGPGKLSNEGEERQDEASNEVECASDDSSNKVDQWSDEDGETLNKSSSKVDGSDEPSNGGEDALGEEDKLNELPGDDELK
jgi:hypothetical protein